MFRFVASRAAATAAATAAGATAAALAVSNKTTAAADAAPPPEPLRVLVTGFLDWRELENNIWRCRDNPSCRLLLGEPCAMPPIERRGPLVRALAERAPAAAEFTYVALPTLWGTANSIDYGGYDLVVHLGLGVYDCTDRIVVEKGAWNARSEAPDAAGSSPASGHRLSRRSTADKPMLEGLMAPKVLRVAGDSKGAPPLPHGFEAELAAARTHNTYICNETHHRALTAVAADGVRCRSAYFLHLPYAAGDDSSHAKLADAVAVLVVRMVEEELGVCERRK